MFVNTRGTIPWFMNFPTTTTLNSSKFILKYDVTLQFFANSLVLNREIIIDTDFSKNITRFAASCMANTKEIRVVTIKEEKWWHLKIIHLVYIYKTFNNNNNNKFHVIRWEEKSAARIFHVLPNATFSCLTLSGSPLLGGRTGLTA